MATKFSQFTAGATTANTLIVGFDSNLNTNNKYNLSQLAAGISPYISIDTIFTTSPTSTVPTGQTIKLTDTIQFQGPTTAYAGLVYEPATTPNGAYGKIKLDGRVLVANYAANDGWAFGQYISNPSNRPNADNSFHFNTGAFNQSDGWAMRIHGGGNANGALIVKGSGTSTAKTLTTQDSGGNETFSIQDDGVAKYTGQVYTELHDTTNATLTVDWNNGNVQELTSLTGSLTFTPSNPKAGATYILTLAQTGAVTATWTGIKWPADTPPTLSGAGKTDVITLICYDETGAGLYYGASTLNFTT